MRIRRMSGGDRPGDGRGHVIAVELGKARDQGLGACGRRLEKDRNLLRILDLALPAIDGAARAEDVCAGGEPVLDECPGDARRFLLAREGRVDAGSRSCSSR